MRRFLFTLLLASGLAACADDATAPDNGSSFLLDETAVLAYGSMDMGQPGGHYMARLHLLPDSIALSAAQREQIKSLMEGFAATVRPDLEALRAIHEEARTARAAGKSDAEIRAIYAKGDAIRTRLHEAEAKLRTDIEALLTPAQKAWLTNPPPHPCAPLQLSEAQKTQITALIAAFEVANRTDLDAIKAVFEEARAAHQAGATRDQITTILAKAAPAMQRIHAAQTALQASIRAVLTPEQVAAGCFGRPGGVRIRR